MLNYWLEPLIIDVESPRGSSLFAASSAAAKVAVEAFVDSTATVMVDAMTDAATAASKPSSILPPYRRRHGSDWALPVLEYSVIDITG